MRKQVHFIFKSELMKKITRKKILKEKNSYLGTVLRYSKTKQKQPYFR